MAGMDDYVASIKAAFITLGSKAVEGILIGYLPFLASPIISPVLDYIVGKIMTDLVTDGEIAAFFVYIDLRVTEQGRTFSEAAIKNHEAQLHGTEHEKAMAKQELLKAFIPFARVSS